MAVTSFDDDEANAEAFVGVDVDVDEDGDDDGGNELLRGCEDMASVKIVYTITINTFSNTKPKKKNDISKLTASFF